MGIFFYNFENHSLCFRISFPKAIFVASNSTYVDLRKNNRKKQLTLLNKKRQIKTNLCFPFLCLVGVTTIPDKIEGVDSSNFSREVDAFPFLLNPPCPDSKLNACFRNTNNNITTYPALLPGKRGDSKLQGQSKVEYCENCGCPGSSTKATQNGDLKWATQGAQKCDEKR